MLFCIGLLTVESRLCMFCNPHFRTLGDHCRVACATLQSMSDILNSAVSLTYCTQFLWIYGIVFEYPSSMCLPKFSALPPLCLSEFISNYGLFTVQNCWIVPHIFRTHCPVWCWALIFANYFRDFAMELVEIQLLQAQICGGFIYLFISIMGRLLQGEWRCFTLNQFEWSVWGKLLVSENQYLTNTDIFQQVVHW